MYKYKFLYYVSHRINIQGRGNKKDIYLARFASNMFPDIDFDDLKETLSFDKKAVNSEIFLVR